MVRLEEDISAHLGSPFTIEDAGNEKGRLVIEYGSSEIRDGLLEMIYPELYSSEDEFELVPSRSPEFCAKCTVLIIKGFL